MAGSELAAIASVPDQKQKTELYRAALQEILASASVDSCNAFVDHMLSDAVALVISRQLLQNYAVEMANMPAEVFKPVATYALEKIQPRVVSFEESVTLIRENLATLLETEAQWSKAAQVLAGIDLDSGSRGVDAGYRLQKSIKIAMLFLEDDDPVNAEMYIKKASSVISSCKDEGLELQYKVCYCRILDSKRRFLEAGVRYYELSSMTTRNVGGHMIDEEELLHSLKCAITCAVLAPAGPQRSRLLSTLYKDERSESLPVYSFLEKVYLERILRREEVEAFAQDLKAHQMAALPDGSTVLDRAVVQHNLLSASKLYNNISIQELGNLLDVTLERAEAMASDMILDGRLSGSIDQVEGIIRFDDKEEALLQWDTHIQSACSKVNDICNDMILAGIKL